SQMVQKMAPMKATSVMATAGISASCGDQRLQRTLPARAMGPACADATSVGDELLSTVNASPSKCDLFGLALAGCIIVKLRSWSWRRQPANARPGPIVKLRAYENGRGELSDGG